MISPTKRQVNQQKVCSSQCFCFTQNRLVTFAIQLSVPLRRSSRQDYTMPRCFDSEISPAVGGKTIQTLKTSCDQESHQNRSIQFLQVWRWKKNIYIYIFYIHICLFIYPIWQLWSFSDVWRFVFNPQTELMVCPKNHWVCPQTHKFVGRQAPALCQRKVALHQWSVVRHLKRCYSRMEFWDINFEWKIIEQTYIYIYIWKSLKSLIKSILNIYTEKKEEKS